MNQELESKDEFMFQEIKKLRTQFEEHKDNITIEECDKLLANVKDSFKGRNIEKELWLYCKEKHPDLIRTVKDFYSRLQKKDSHICIEGETGSGKSTLTLSLCMLMSYKLNKHLDFERNVLFIPKPAELSIRLARLKEYELLWVDETIKSLNKARWHDPNAIESNETVQTERFRHNTVFYCVPSFTELTKSFRDVNIKFRVWCIDCEIAFVRVKEIDPDIKGTYGAWHMAYRAKVKIDKRISGESSVYEREAAEERLPGYIRSFDWPDLENIPGFAGMHLCYEIEKKRSRLVIAATYVDPTEIPKTASERKAMASLKGLMLKHMKKETSTIFEPWWKENGEFINLSKRTCLHWWNDVKKKEEVALKKMDVHKSIIFLPKEIENGDRR